MSFILLIFIAAFGLVMGSFFNVVIARLPKMMEFQFRKQCSEYLNLPFDTSEKTFNLAVPRSHCPHCKKALKILQNIPLFSFFWLKGSCAFCHQSISWQYPIVEFLTALLFCAVVGHYGLTITSVYALVFTSILIILAFVDLKTLLLPDELTLSLLWLGLYINVQHTFTSLQDAVIGALVGYLFLWCVAFAFKKIRHKDGLGHGDFKMLAALGAWFGLETMLIVLLLSVCISLVTSLALLAIRKISTQQLIPFGPFLAIAGWVALLWQAELQQLFIHLFWIH